MTEKYPLATLLRCSGSPTTHHPLDDSVREYRPGKSYFTGDLVEFCGVLYMCVAPEGIPCRLSPAQRHRDWEEQDDY